MSSNLPSLCNCLVSVPPPIHLPLTNTRGTWKNKKEFIRFTAYLLIGHLFPFEKNCQSLRNYCPNNIFFLEKQFLYIIHKTSIKQRDLTNSDSVSSMMPSGCLLTKSPTYVIRAFIHSNLSCCLVPPLHICCYYLFAIQ